MTKDIKTSKKDFELFKNYCKKYIALFELNDYEVHFHHEKLRDVYATTSTNVMDHVAVITLNTSIPEGGNLKKIALHEVCHLIFAKLSWLASCRYLDESEIREADEEATVKLTNALNKRINI